MKTKNGPMLHYRIVYRVLPRRIYELRDDGFYHACEWQRGLLVESVGMGGVMHHRPEDFLEWKCKTRFT